MTLRSLLLCSFLTVAAVAQHAPDQLGVVPLAQRPAVQAGQPIPDQWIVQFAQRSFDLEPYRQAILARRPAAEVDAIVAAMEQQVRLDQAAFVVAVEGLGGRVTAQWWLINGCAVTLPAAQVAAMRALPNVASVHADVWHVATLTDSTNATHSDSDAANLKDAKGGGKVIGTGISVAILDTGADANMSGLGRPHRAYFRGGNPGNTSGGGIGGSLLLGAHGTSGYGTEDVHSHGTFVAGCAQANKWSSSALVDNGPAFDSRIVSIKISDDTGSAASNWIVSAWQLVGSRRATDNIGVANNSFSGSPSLGDPTQVAIDSLAFNSDVLITCSAGNFGSNTQNSQSVYNGLSVGSIDKYSGGARSGFSAVGPLFGTTRTYPDIVACGNGVYATLRDSESSISQSSGTSFSSPTAAGGAALVRHADTKITALQAKAILLNTTNPLSGVRNQIGLGLMKCNTAVDAALAGDYQTVRLTHTNKVHNAPFTAVQGVPRSITVTWMRSGSAVPYNIDLKIFDAANNQVGADLNPQNSYEKVRFTPGASGTFRAEITWKDFTLPAEFVDVAISGAGPVCTNLPTLGAANPNQVKSYNGGSVTLTGTNLNGATAVDFGGLTVTSLSNVTPTQVTFTVPSPAAIGPVQVKVLTPCGASNGIGITVVGTHPAVLEGRAIVVRSNTTTYDFKVHGDRNWTSLMLVSLSNKPSTIPGIVNLGIGDNFTLIYWDIGTRGHDQNGVATFPLLFPTILSSPMTLWFQAIHYDPTNLTLPLETTGVFQTSVF
jgi:hypothetical protein